MGAMGAPDQAGHEDITILAFCLNILNIKYVNGTLSTT
jgi:hypothetical protein